jgi:uncharacterized membrane protein
LEGLCDGLERIERAVPRHGADVVGKVLVGLFKRSQKPHQTAVAILQLGRLLREVREDAASLLLGRLAEQFQQAHVIAFRQERR